MTAPAENDAPHGGSTHVSVAESDSDTAGKGSGFTVSRDVRVRGVLFVLFVYFSFPFLVHFGVCCLFFIVHFVVCSSLCTLGRIVSS